MLADNRWLAQVIGDLRKILKLARLQQLHAPGRLEQSLSEHLAVFAALKARDSEGAEAAMRTHLTRQREALRDVALATESEADLMNASDWITRSVSRLRPAARRRARPSEASRPAARGPRPLAERLEATLRRNGEALSPRALRRALAELQAVVDPRVSEVEGGRRAHAVVQLVRRRDARRAARHLAADERAVRARPAEGQQTRADQLRGRGGHARRRPGRGAPAPRLGVAARAPAAALHRRPGGHALPGRPARRTAAAPEGRQAPAARSTPRWSTCSPPGSTSAFLDLRRISWDSPASLIEKLIKYEAVHDIQQLGRREEPARQRPPLLRLLPSAAARTSR